MPGREGVVPACAVGEHLDSVGGDETRRRSPRSGGLGRAACGPFGEVGHRDVPSVAPRVGMRTLKEIMRPTVIHVGLAGEFREAGILGEALHVRMLEPRLQAAQSRDRCECGRKRRGISSEGLPDWSGRDASLRHSVRRGYKGAQRARNRWDPTDARLLGPAQ